jgi:glycosyltransferase involved in cell wall biosynthesis
LESKNNNQEVTAAKICLVSDHHLCTNPRAWKEAKTLVTNGYDVTIVTIFHSAASLQRDKELLAGLPAGIQYVSAVSYIEGQIPSWKRLLYKGVSKLAVLGKKAGVDSVYLLSNNPNEIYRKAFQVNADLYICHIDCSLYVGKKLIQKGKAVAYDFEDWYSRDYLVPIRPVELLKSLEEYALQHGVYVSCPSHAMANAIYKDYGIRKPEVIYNGFPVESLVKYEIQKTPSLVWFSQTIGPGRGLEKIISALQDISTSVSLNLIGDISDKYRAELEVLFTSCPQHTLSISPQVKHKDLHGLLCGHSIGLALEETYPPSRNTTVTNKILQYLQAGLLVLATATEGQKEVAADFAGIVSTVPPGDINAWKAELELLIAKKDVNRQAIADEFNQKYSWEAQEAKLLELVAGALNRL